MWFTCKVIIEITLVRPKAGIRREELCNIPTSLKTDVMFISLREEKYYYPLN
jgi:hypothetical protein